MVVQGAGDGGMEGYALFMLTRFGGPEILDAEGGEEGD